MLRIFGGGFSREVAGLARVPPGAGRCGDGWTPASLATAGHRFSLRCQHPRVFRRTRGASPAAVAELVRVQTCGARLGGTLALPNLVHLEKASDLGHRDQTASLARPFANDGRQPQFRPRCNRQQSVESSSRAIDMLRQARSSLADVMNNLSVDVGQAVVAAFVAVGELLVVQSQTIEQRRVEVVDTDRVLDDVVRVVIGRPPGEAGPDSPTRQPEAEAPGVMIAAVALAGRRE
jgi:hypothetical protein